MEIEGLKKRCYISGPMTGLPDLNFPAFNDMEQRLKAAGWDVVNPAKLNAPGTDWETCMRVDIRELMRCSVVFVLKGWARSRGASMEIDIAINLGMKVVYVEDFTDKAIAGPERLNQLIM